MAVYKKSKPNKDGRCWYYAISYKDHDKYKRIVSKNFATKKEAALAEAKHKAMIGTKSMAITLKTFDEIITEFLAMKKERVKPQAYQKLINLCNHVSKILGKIAISKMTIDQYKRYYNYVANSGFSTDHKNRMLSHVQALITFANKRYDIVNDIPKKFERFVNVESKKEMDIYTEEEFNQFISVVDNPKHYVFYQLLYCALREGEANALQWKDYKDGTISINKTVSTKLRDENGNYLIGTPKTKSSNRTIPLPKRAIEAIEKAREIQEKQDGFNEDWFIVGGMKPLAESSMQKFNERYAAKANLRAIRIHDFRHSFVSLVIRQGNVNIVALSKYVGHDNPAITLNTYSHMFPTDFNDIIKLIEK